MVTMCGHPAFRKADIDLIENMQRRTRFIVEINKLDYQARTI